MAGDSDPVLYQGFIHENKIYDTHESIWIAAGVSNGHGGTNGSSTSKRGLPFRIDYKLWLLDPTINNLSLCFRACM